MAALRGLTHLTGNLVARRQIGKQIFSGTSFLILIAFDKALREKDDSPKTNGCLQAGILDTKWNSQIQGFKWVGKDNSQFQTQKDKI